MQSESMEYDVLIIGAGPAGLATAIHLQQLAQQQQRTLRICILEKGAQIGAHILSGAVLDHSALQELLPMHWQDAPLDTLVSSEQFYYLTARHAIRLPTPSPMQNKNNFIISLGSLCKFLAQQAEQLGCEIYTGFAATEILYNTHNHVIGVKTGDVGINKQQEVTALYQPGMHLLATQTIFAEGCRGQLTECLMHRFQLQNFNQAQTYGIGLKEIWRIPKKQHQLGRVMHTIGWPLTQQTYGGSFVYHLSDSQIALGLVIGLDYKNPWLSPFDELQRFKLHPYIKSLLTGGERLAYGARALNEGGWQALPQLTVPGGLIVGDAAGMLNVPRLKGIHNAIRSGMLAAASYVDTYITPKTIEPIIQLKQYQTNFNQSRIAQELYKVRNIRPGFHHGLWLGLANAFWETYISHGRSPWTLKHNADYQSLQLAANAKKIIYPKPDNCITFDKLSSVHISNTHHAADQPCHLQLRDPKLAIDTNYILYASPEIRYCPAGVYEIVQLQQQASLQINAQNCIHCKTCDIKDPKQNIVWQAPEGGGGPNYSAM